METATHSNGVSKGGGDTYVRSAFDLFRMGPLLDGKRVGTEGRYIVRQN